MEEGLCEAEQVVTKSRLANIGLGRLSVMRSYFGDHIREGSKVCEKCILRAVRGSKKGGINSNSNAVASSSAMPVERPKRNLSKKAVNKTPKRQEKKRTRRRGGDNDVDGDDDDDDNGDNDDNGVGGSVRVDFVVEAPVHLDADAIRASIKKANATLAQNHYHLVSLTLNRHLKITFKDLPYRVCRGIEWFIGCASIVRAVEDIPCDMTWIAKLPPFSEPLLQKVGNYLVSHKNVDFGSASPIQRALISLLSQEGGAISMYGKVLSDADVVSLCEFAAAHPTLRQDGGDDNRERRCIFLWTRAFARGPTVMWIEGPYDVLDPWNQVRLTLSGTPGNLRIPAKRLFIGDPRLCSEYPQHQVAPETVVHALYLENDDALYHT